MTPQLYVIGSGAVTPVGLNAMQTCAGIRARVSRYEEVVRNSPFGQPQAVARIPAHWKLRSTDVEWLVNMAVRAITEVVQRLAVTPDRTALIVIPPEAFRRPAFEDGDGIDALSDRISRKLPFEFHSVTQLIGGAASTVLALDLAARMLQAKEVSRVVVGGVDSYVLENEYTRLEAAGRLRTEGKAQGLTPGEAAVFLLLSSQLPEQPEPSVAVVSWAHASERLCATSDGYSQGHGMLAALKATVDRAKVHEGAVDSVISNSNGERYSSWESVLAHARFYRMRREILVTTYPAMSVGETGSASGPLGLMIAAHGFTRRCRPGNTAMVELASEGEGRAACLVASSQRAPRS
jgi:3-oxoacyl-[acyl-carrier-protein] synthase-1